MELVEEDNTVFKNKKIVLSSIAIIFALVVSSIFVNYTLANSDSQASVSDATGSGTTTGLTGLSNIDLAIENSNNASKKATGEDKYRIVQIVPDTYADYATMDNKLKSEVASKKLTTADSVRKLTGYDKTTYLWRYVYAGEYFRLAVFNGYKTIKDNMAAGAVTLTTCTVSELNSMNANAQEILNQADFIYIWANSSSDYASTSGDISEDLYNWLDAYATANSHPIAMVSGTLCTDTPSGIVGNNDTYRMGTLAYKLITKNVVARYDNVLVTDADFFKTLYEEADENNEPTPDIEKTKYTISDFILKAERTASQGGSDYLNFGTYYKWYDGVSITDFLDGNIPDSITDSTYDKAGSRSGLTGDRKEWNFDNAKVLIISEDGANSAMFTEMKEKSSGNSAESAASDYKFDKKTQTWKSVEKAPNSELTGHMYANGTSASGTGISKYVPSGADIYVLDSANIVDALTNGGVPYSNMALSNSAYMDVKTKTVSGTVRLTDMAVDDDHALAVEDVNLSAYLVVDNGTELHLAGTSAGEMMMCPLTKQEIPKLDTNGDELTDDDGNTIMETVYTYSFPKLDPSYNYKVVIGGDDGFSADDYTVGMAQAGEDSANGDTQDNADADNVYDFIIKAAEETNVDGYTFRKDAEGNEDATVVVTRDDFNASVDKPDLGAVYKSDLIYTGFDLSDESKIAEYVKNQHDAYTASQIGLVSANPDKVDLTQFDFVFIDKGTYNKEIGQDVFKALTGGVESGQYFIVSSKAGDGKGSNTGAGGGNDKPGITVITSPSAKAIADVINASVYRDGADNKFKVLEIQPDYPIDVDLAESKSGGSSYTKHSDGSSFTGDYYTVPSDVVSGKAKEELPSITEYYEFDLTKAKIAYALRDLGVKYGDVDLTQVSTEALVGMSEDVMASYDLIYIGGDISAMDRSLDEVYAYNPIGNGTGAYALGYGIPTFIMYTHTGMLQKVKANSTIEGKPVMATGVNGGTADVYMPENGNDLTKTKFDQLSAYVTSGRPVMVSSELTSVYEKMNGYNVSGNTKTLSDVQRMSGYWFKDDGDIERGNMYLDPSSRMYSLIDIIYARKNSQTASSSVLWGIDMSDTQPIDNADMTYGDGLWTMKVENGNVTDDIPDTDAQSKAWYNKESQSYKVYKKYAMVPSDMNCSLIKNLVQRSVSRARINIITKPTKYVQGIESTYLRTTSLPFEFNITGPLSSYTYKLYVDKDKNGTYDADNDYYLSDTFKSGENVKVTVNLDDTFFGSAAWYLEIIDSDKNVIATSSGLSKIVKTIDGKADINVLQIQTMCKGQSADYQTMPDMLYFDIESQWAHKIMYYNGAADDVRFDSAMNLKQNSVLGRHENRFGIVEYDYSAGDDNWFTNLADALTEDYDINLDMVVATADKAGFTTTDGVSGTYGCLDTWVEEAETLKKGGSVEGHDKDWYSQNLVAALDEYNTASAAVDAPKKKIDAFLTGAIAHINGTTVNDAKYKTFKDNIRNGSTEQLTQLYQTAIDTGEYYLVFLKYFSKTDINSDADLDNFGEYGKLFKEYRNAKNAELNARDKYQTYLRRSYAEDFLTNMYSILVLGPSDDFGNFEIDLKQTTCDYIKRYVDNGGDLFFFHDTMTPYYNYGAYNLTKTLLDVVGMNRFHVDMTNQANSYTSKSVQTITGYTKSTPAGVKYGTLEEDGYIYQSTNNHSEMPAGYANFSGTLSEDCDVYDYSYKHQNDNSWTAVSGQIPVLDTQNYQVNNRDQMVMKHMIAGTQVNDVYVYQDVVKYDKLGIIENDKITRNEYFKKVEAKAGQSGYIYQDAVEGGDPIYGDSINEMEFKSTNSNLYYLTKYANNPDLNQTAGLYNSIKANITDSPKAGDLGQVTSSGWNISALSMSSMYYAMDKSMGDGKYLNYIYANMDVNDAVKKTVRDGNHDETDLSQTAKASQLNEGLVTLYPFNIGSSLNISGTHQQAYSLDIENSNTKVWYTLAGCNNNSNKKAKSSMYAADPYDAMESYFIYTSAYGSGAITYCGAGHTSVTGSKTKNNDERKLFINVIVNSAAAVQPAPTLKCFEPKQTWKSEDELPKDKEALASTGRTVYVKTVDSKTEAPSFDYLVKIPNLTRITSVRLYYDLNYDDSDYSNRPSYTDGTDKLITEYTTKGDKSLTEITGELKEIARDDGTNVRLAPSDVCFAPYGGTYTYIVVEVYYQGKTTPVYALIKVKASDPLFDLTDNTIDVPAYDDFIAEKKKVFA